MKKRYRTSPEQRQAGRERAAAAQQEAFLSKLFDGKSECPWCSEPVSFFDAVEPAFNFREVGFKCACPECGKGLKKAVPFSGMPAWLWLKAGKRFIVLAPNDPQPVDGLLGKAVDEGHPLLAEAAYSDAKRPADLEIGEILTITIKKAFKNLVPGVHRIRRVGDDE